MFAAGMSLAVVVMVAFNCLFLKLSRKICDDSRFDGSGISGINLNACLCKCIQCAFAYSAANKNVRLILLKDTCKSAVSLPIV